MKIWLCRNTHGILSLHWTEPFKVQYNDHTYWDSVGEYDRHYLRYDDHFPEVTFENSPVEVELKLIEK